MELCLELCSPVSPAADVLTRTRTGALHNGLRISARPACLLLVFSARARRRVARALTRGMLARRAVNVGEPGMTPTEVHYYAPSPTEQVSFAPPRPSLRVPALSCQARPG